MNSMASTYQVWFQIPKVVRWMFVIAGDLYKGLHLDLDFKAGSQILNHKVQNSYFNNHEDHEVD